ncbi:ASCH domain-containing protein [Limosilactobacillus viscerum]|uniref:ASCH domain-containing protein n=1 Tax=Limosilactobacillus viscerum TaxID=2993450 RepID=UPI0024BB126A|nr:ASCH domain-containing protein [Limosilactobacillus viscerum]
MKALSLHPENAAAVAWGDKLVEYRTWQTKYRGPLLICASAKKTPGFLAGYALCVMNLEEIYQFPDGSFGWRFSPYKTGQSYHVEPFPVKGRQRLFIVSDNLIVPVNWEHDGQVDLTKAHQWFEKVYEPLIMANE